MPKPARGERWWQEKVLTKWCGWVLLLIITEVFSFIVSFATTPLISSVLRIKPVPFPSFLEYVDHDRCRKEYISWVIILEESDGGGRSPDMMMMMTTILVVRHDIHHNDCGGRCCLYPYRDTVIISLHEA